MSEYNFEKCSNETLAKHLHRISLDKTNKLHSKDWLDIKEEFDFEHSGETLRKHAAGWKWLDDNGLQVVERESITEEGYKEVTEILNNGNSYRSDKLLRMNSEQSKDPEFLLQAHGFDVNKWELINARNNIWNTNSVAQGVQTLYSSRITAKPKKNGIDFDRIIEKMKNDITPVKVDSPKETESKLLEISLFDMHFGIADFNHYKDVYNEIIHKISSRVWDSVLFVVGQDLFHNDGFTGETTSGTKIDKVDMEKAWMHAYRFYTGLIVEALGNSKKVNLIYSNGNHDQGICYGFIKTLEVKFPQIHTDARMRQRKGFTWNKVFLGFSHGDRGRARLEKNFLREYKTDIANADVVEIHSGHLHHEVTKDDLGIVLRTLSTKAKTDDYHYENGFTGAMKRFQLFEYSPSSLDAIYYV